MGNETATPAPATLEEALVVLEAQGTEIETLKAAQAVGLQDLEAAETARQEAVSAKETAEAKLKETEETLEHAEDKIRASTSGKPTVTVEAEGDLLALFGKWLSQRRSQLGPVGRNDTTGNAIARQLVAGFGKALGVELPSVEDTDKAFAAIAATLPDMKG